MTLFAFSKTQNRINVLSATNHSLNDRIKEMTKANQFKSEEFQNMQKERNALRNERDSMRKENEQFQRQRKSKAQRINELNSEMAQLKQSQIIAAHEKDAFESKYEALRVKFDSSVMNSEALSAKVQGLESKNKRQRQSNISLEKENKSVKVKK